MAQGDYVITNEGMINAAAREARRLANPVVSVAEYEHRRDLDQYRQREKARLEAKRKQGRLRKRQNEPLVPHETQRLGVPRPQVEVGAPRPILRHQRGRRRVRFRAVVSTVERRAHAGQCPKESDR